MGDNSWTVLCFGGAYQAHARGYVPGCPVLIETHALGAPRATQTAAEADGWASGLPPDGDYVPLTARPALPRVVVTAVPEPVLVPAPAPSRVLVVEPEPLPEPPRPAPVRKPLKRAPAARKPRKG